MSTFTIVPDDERLKAKIKIVGVGGGGCNALDSMVGKGLQGVDFVAVDTDSQKLKKSKAYIKLQVGSRSTRGLGAGSRPGVGEDAAIEDKARIAEALDGADMVFIAAAMGGGTGTGASPVVAKIAKENTALTIAIVSMPFSFEGESKTAAAEEGLSRLEKEVDTLIVVPNDKLCEEDNPPPLQEAFESANNVLFRAVNGITEIINTPGLINTDFADIKTIMSQDGSKAIMGTGAAEGSDRAVKAAESAVESPLLGALSIEGAKGALLHIVAPPDFGTDELKKACNYVTQKASKDMQFIFGWTIDENIKDEVRITIIATGIESSSSRAEGSPRPPAKPGSSTAPPPGPIDGDLFPDAPIANGPDRDIPAYLRDKKLNPAKQENAEKDKPDESKTEPSSAGRSIFGARFGKKGD
ncbi:cell division protein FtsZ [Candidatus Mycalebacterium sp.]